MMMMMKFAVPYDEDDYGDTDVWHSLRGATWVSNNFGTFNPMKFTFFSHSLGKRLKYQEGTFISTKFKTQ